MAQLERLPDDMVFFTQITMEAAEDPEFLAAMRRAQNPRRARRHRVGHARRTEGGLQELQRRRRGARHDGCRHFGRKACTSSDRSSSDFRPTPPRRSPQTADLAQHSGVSFAQFVMLTPFPGTRGLRQMGAAGSRRRDGSTASRSPVLADSAASQRPKVYTPHPTMSAETIRRGTQHVVGPFLHASGDLAALHVRAFAPRADRVPADLEAVSADVRQYRHRDR